MNELFKPMLVLSIYIVALVLLLPPQAALTHRSQPHRMKETKFHDAARTRPITHPVPRCRHDRVLLQEIQKTKAKLGDPLGLQMDKQACSGRIGRHGMVILV